MIKHECGGTDYTLSELEIMAGMPDNAIMASLAATVAQFDDVAVFGEIEDVAGPMSLVDMEVARVNYLAQQARKYPAIGDYMAETGANLADAVEYMERMARGVERESRADSAQWARDQREAMNAAGMDIADWTLQQTDGSIEARDRLAKEMGYRGAWGEGVARREKARDANIHSTGSAIGGKSRKAKAVKADTPAEPATAQAKAVTCIGKPAPATTNRDELTAWAREYCRELCERYQSAKLTQKLYGRTPGGGSLAFQLEAMPADDTRLPLWAQSAAMSFDKKVGAA